MTVTARPADIRSLLRLDEGYVHSDVYTSPALFEREMEQIFHRGWVFVGHASEVPASGDYAEHWIGRQGVIMTRTPGGSVEVITSDAATPVPRTAIYRGFVWGSLSASGPSLDEHLGVAAKRAIDLFCDHSPVGEIEVGHGANKSVIYANWKFQGGDGYHPPFTHQAAMGPIRAQRMGRPNPLVQILKADTTSSRDLGHGHFCLDIRTLFSAPPPSEPWAQEYVASMLARYGEKRAKYILDSGGPHTLLMPNIQLLNPDLRVLRPIAADQFEITFYCAFLKGVPKEVNVARLRHTESTMGPAGSVNVDDVEMFERNQLGMQQRIDPWKFIGRGMAREHVDNDDAAPDEYKFLNSKAAHYSDELPQRAQLRWWATQLEAG